LSGIFQFLVNFVKLALKNHDNIQRPHVRTE